MKALGRETANALERGELDHFGALLSEQWARKFDRSPTPVHERVDGWIRAGLEAGALGGKLVGAGDGGFLPLLFGGEGRPRARRCDDEGLDEVRFGIDYLGAHRHRLGLMEPVAVLAGGLGTRLREVTGDALPKAMVEVDGRPFIDHKLRELHDEGAHDVLLLIGHGAGAIRDHVGDGTSFGLQITTLEDGPELLGTGGAIVRARPRLGPRFWVTYGDTLLDVDVAHAEDALARSGALALMTVLENRDRWQASNAVVRDDRVVEYSKDPRPDGAGHIDYGMLLFDTAAFDGRTPHTAFDLAHLLGELAANDSLIAFVVTEPFRDIGTPDALRDTEAWLRARVGPDGESWRSVARAASGGHRAHPVSTIDHPRHRSPRQERFGGVAPVNAGCLQHLVADHLLEPGHEPRPHHLEPGSLERGRERRRFEEPDVHVGDARVGPSGEVVAVRSGVARREIQQSTRGEDALDVAQDVDRVDRVLEHLDRGDHVEASVELVELGPADVRDPAVAHAVGAVALFEADDLAPDGRADVTDEATEPSAVVEPPRRRRHRRHGGHDLDQALPLVHADGSRVLHLTLVVDERVGTATRVVGLVIEHREVGTGLHDVRI